MGRAGKHFFLVSRNSHPDMCLVQTFLAARQKRHLKGGQIQTVSSVFVGKNIKLLHNQDRWGGGQCVWQLTDFQPPALQRNTACHLLGALMLKWLTKSAQVKKCLTPSLEHCPKQDQNSSGKRSKKARWQEEKQLIVWFNHIPS